MSKAVFVLNLITCSLWKLRNDSNYCAISAYCIFADRRKPAASKPYFIFSEAPFVP